VVRREGLDGLRKVRNNSVSITDSYQESPAYKSGMLLSDLLFDKPVTCNSVFSLIRC
jgi:hypothetical protein